MTEIIEYVVLLFDDHFIFAISADNGVNQLIMVLDPESVLDPALELNQVINIKYFSSKNVGEFKQKLSK